MDGQVKRMNRTLKQMLSEVVKKNSKDYNEILHPALFVYRTAPKSSNGEIPFSLVSRRDDRAPNSLDFYQSVNSLPVLESDYTQELFTETT